MPKSQRELEQDAVIDLLNVHLKDRTAQRDAALADRAELRAALVMLIKDRDRGLESSPDTWEYARSVLKFLQVPT